jgi:pimeloyl-ACP methyl ester carboxylesterase
MPFSLLIGGLLACTDVSLETATETTSVRVVPSWDFSTAALFDAPYPSDLRRTDLGTIDLTTFPNPFNLSIIDNYVAIANTLNGYGTSSPLYVKFDGTIDTTRLPDPETSRLEESSLQLVNVDPSSQDWGLRTPITYKYYPTETTYQPANLLSITPYYGFVLDADTTYALIVTTALADQNSEFADTFEPSSDLYAHVAPLLDALPTLGLTPDDVAIATLFTTDNPLTEMAAISDQIKTAMNPVDLSQTLVARSEFADYLSFTGSYIGPLYQHGERPYEETGGDFRFEEDGTPILFEMESIRLSLSLPKDKEAPKNGWPVVLYAHGTGGNYLTFCNSTSDREPAAAFGREGFVGISFDQPLHGTRANKATDAELYTFNYQNADAGRTNHRQGAIDFIYLLHGLRTLSATFETDTGETIAIDPTQLYLMGHSQGGTTGALALPFVGEEVKAAVLSGAGGGLAITIIERKDPVDIKSLLSVLLGLEPDEALTEDHPVVGLVQTVIEVSDPINFAPYWFHSSGDWIGDKPTPTLAFSGVNDTYTPYRSAVAMAAAARMPQLEPIPEPSNAHELAGLVPTIMPAFENAVNADGGAITAGLSAFLYGDHYVIFDEDEAVDQYLSLLTSTRAGEPAIHATDEPK